MTFIEKITSLASSSDQPTTRAGTQDKETRAMVTVPWIGRSSNGLYVGEDRSVWLYRKLPAYSYSWEPFDTRIAAGSALHQMLIEIGKTSKTPAMGEFASLAKNRKVHFFSHVRYVRPSLPKGASPDLANFLTEVFETDGTAVPEQVTMIGIELWPSGTFNRRRNRSMVKQLRQFVSQFTNTDMPDIDKYEADMIEVSTLLGRYDAVVPTTSDLRTMERWLSGGSTREPFYIEEVDRLIVRDRNPHTFDRWIHLRDLAVAADEDGDHQRADELALEAESQITAGGNVIQFLAIPEEGLPGNGMGVAPDAPWISDAQQHENAAITVSLRFQLEPASITRNRARKTQRRATKQTIEEEEANSKFSASATLERVELTETLVGAQSVEDYYAMSGEPSIVKLSQIFAWVMKDASEESFDDFWRAKYELDAVPLLQRQAEALLETLPCSPMLAAPQRPFVHDAMISLIAHSGIGSAGTLGDDITASSNVEKLGMFAGIAHPGGTPNWLNPFAASEQNSAPTMAVIGDPGSGKATTLDTLIVTPHGFRKMGEMKIGDLVMGADGNPHKVTGVFPQGEKEIFRVAFSDHSTVECCEDHLWYVSKTCVDTSLSDGRSVLKGIPRGERWEVIRTGDLRNNLRVGNVTKGARRERRRQVLDALANGPHTRLELIEQTGIPSTSLVRTLDRLLSSGEVIDVSMGAFERRFGTGSILPDSSPDTECGQYKWIIPMTRPVAFSEKCLPVDPYLLGLLLGDGSMDHRSGVKLTTADVEIVENVKDVLPAGMSIRRINDNRGIHYSIAQTEHVVLGGRLGSTPNPIKRELDKLGLLDVNVYTKFIPDPYMTGSIAQREALLQGLMDSDGTVNRANNQLKFSTVSPRLADGLSELVWSLGGTISVCEQRNTYTWKEEKKRGVLSYEIGIVLPREIQAFRLTRKSKAFHAESKLQPVRTIRSIEPVGFKEAQCISVDSPDELFLVGKEMVVTHNTFLVQALLYQVALQGISAWFVNPKGSDSLKTYADFCGGETIVISQVEPGAFDPFRYAEGSTIVEIALDHISTSLNARGDGLNRNQTIALSQALFDGVTNRVGCVGKCLDFLPPEHSELTKQIKDWASTNSNFALGISMVPRGPMGATRRFTLVEFDQESALPENTNPNELSMTENSALAGQRLMWRAGIEVMRAAGGGVVAGDEAWTFLSSPQAASVINGLNRKGRSLGIFLILMTQKIADIATSDMEGYLSRVGIMKLDDEREIAAALELCRMEKTPELVDLIRASKPAPPNPGDPARGIPATSARPSRMIFRDLQGRHGLVTVEPIPETYRRRWSTNRADKAQIALEESPSNFESPNPYESINE